MAFPRAEGRRLEDSLGGRALQGCEGEETWDASVLSHRHKPWAGFRSRQGRVP